MPIIPKALTVIEPLIGSRQTLLDGVAGTFGQDEWVALDYVIPLAVHLQAVSLHWLNAKVGDYGFLVLIHPSGSTNPGAAMAVDDTELTLPSPALAPVYAAALAVEFWNADESVLVERRKIDSVDLETGVVTLATGVSNAHTTSDNIKAVLAAYSPCYGDDCCSGIRMLGDGHEPVSSENELTSAIDAGIIIGCRFKGADLAGERSIVANFRFRLCDGSCQ